MTLSSDIKILKSMIKSSQNENKTINKLIVGCAGRNVFVVNEIRSRETNSLGLKISLQAGHDVLHRIENNNEMIKYLQEEVNDLDTFIRRYERMIISNEEDIDRYQVDINEMINGVYTKYWYNFKNDRIRVATTDEEKAYCMENPIESKRIKLIVSQWKKEKDIGQITAVAVLYHITKHYGTPTDSKWMNIRVFYSDEDVEEWDNRAKK